MALQHHQRSLIDISSTQPTNVIHDEGLSADYYDQFVKGSVADEWFERLFHQVDWQQDTVTVYGKQYLTPRLSCWMGEPWMTYSYSNQTMIPKAWHPLALSIKQQIEQCTGDTFNSVLINQYRDGKDSNGWHADDEPELGHWPIIASLSLGAERDFCLRKKSDHRQKVKLGLRHGSLLVMRGATQEMWQHSVPKRAHADVRINLTFRKIVRP